MSDAPEAPDPVTEPVAAPAAEPVAATAAQPERASGGWRRAVWRWTRRLLAVAVAVVVAVIVSFFSIDLGRFPALKDVAERRASKYLDRPMRIGRIYALVTPGKFAFDDVVIDGKTPGAPPFFVAKRITMYVPWWTLFKNRLQVEVELIGWKMTVETFAGGGHNVPRLTPRESTEPKRRLPFTTTVNFVYAKDGEFEYIDHATPWSIKGPNLSFELVRSEALKSYVGKARFTGGTVRIQKYLPMSADFTTRFVLDGGKVQLRHIDLLTDGAVSHVSGTVDFGRWPDQVYTVSSTVNLPRMREIFFANESWRLAGNGDFAGIFRIFKAGGFNLSGQFRSEDVSVDNWRFEALHGSLSWEPRRFVVPHADSRVLGGDLRFTYGVEPLGTKQGATTTVTAEYENLDLHSFTRAPDINWTVLDPDGRMRGRVAMAWPNGRFKQALQGDGETTITPAGGAVVASASLPASAPIGPQHKAFDPALTPGRFSLAAQAKYRFTSESLDFEPSTAATPSTHVAFSGHAVGGEVKLPFHVTSYDWLESDRLFAAIMAEFSSPVGAIDVGGRGTFDGEVSRTFRAPRIQGKFSSDQMRAWDVVWGRAEGDLVIESGFMDIKDGRITGEAGASIRTDGRYALGFKPGMEEMNAHVRVSTWPLKDLRHAFGLDEWPVDGLVGEADLQLRGPYRELKGTGKMRLDQGVAWKEPFETATADLVFEGDGLRVSRIEMTKSPGHVTGDAWIGWNGSYVFAADGARIPVESLTNFKVEKAPLSGILQFKARGEGQFDRPTYEFDGTVADLYAADEGIGQVHGKITVKDNVLTIDRLDAVSNRLQVTGSGSIALNEHSDAKLFFRMFETSLDPYLKFFAPELSPYTRAIVSGTVDIKGPLGEPADLVVDARIDNQNARLTLFDYELRNQGEVRLVFEENTFRISRLVLEGQDTLLDLGGTIDARSERVHLEAKGTANLAILQAFYPDLNANGAATLNATFDGPFGDAALTGTADIHKGRLKLSALPHGFNDINGPIRVESGRISVNGLTAVMGEGPVTFGGHIRLSGGYKPEEYNLTAIGRTMRLRYPPGLVSSVNATLFLEGPVSAPVLRGQIDVLSALYRPRIDPQTGLFGFAAGGAIGVPQAPPVVGTTSGIPLTLDIKVVSPLIAFIDSDTAHLEGRANIDVTGTIDRPAIIGRVTIERGQVFFLENRYFVRSGSIEFLNPLRFEPYFDVTAETRARADGETFTITVQLRGTFDKLEHTLTAEPWLSDVQIVSLLFGGTPNIDTAASLQVSNTSEQARAVQTAMAALVLSPVTSTVGNVVREILPVDVVQCQPQLGNVNNEIALRSLTATARCTLGKRISDRVYLTYSRTLTGNQDEIILLEFDQSDRISWVLSRNEDRSFALDFRIRHRF